MLVVDEMAEAFRKLGAKWVGIEFAVFAPVEESVNGVPANVADSVVDTSALRITDDESEGVVVDGGRDEFLRAIGAVIMEIEVAGMTSEPATGT